MDKSERYLKDIAKNTADIAKELKKQNAKITRQNNANIETDAIRDALNDRN